MSFKNKIKELRLARNLTQEDVAKGTKLSSSAIGMLEQGRRNPSYEVLEALADFYNVDMNTLTGKDDSIILSTNAIMINQIVSKIPDAKEAIDLYSQLDDIDRAGVRGEMRGLLKSPKYSINFDSPELTIAASGLDENTPLSDENKEVIKRRIDQIKAKRK